MCVCEYDHFLISFSLKKLIKYYYVHNISLFTFFLQLVKESSQLII